VLRSVGVARALKVLLAGSIPCSRICCAELKLVLLFGVIEVLEDPVFEFERWLWKSV